MHVNDMSWSDHQVTETAWHGDCLTTFGEETKQLEYAWRMGLRQIPYGGHWPVYDLDGRSVLDIGGGPVSMLLKCINRSESAVADPCPYPEWVVKRYTDNGIYYLRVKGEDVIDYGSGFDEVWIYNCLQHTENPEKIVRDARKIAPVLRIFEWIDIPPHEGHPNELKEADLNEWIGGTGTVEVMTGQNGCVGRAYFGVFSGQG